MNQVKEEMACYDAGVRAVHFEVAFVVRLSCCRVFCKQEGSWDVTT